MTTLTLDFTKNMKNGYHLNAALGLLDWTIDKLVSESGVSKPTISALKNARSDDDLEKFNVRTVNKIVSAINKAGVRFTDNGVEYNHYPIFFTKGHTHEEAFLELLKDAHEHLLTKNNPELLLMHSDDRVSPKSVISLYKKMRNDGIKMRQLVKEGNRYLLGDLDEYRYIPEKRFMNRVTLIYGDRVANETSDVLQGIIRQDPIQADIQRNNFNLLWDTLNKPKESTADERFI